MHGATALTNAPTKSKLVMALLAKRAPTKEGTQKHRGLKPLEKRFPNIAKKCIQLKEPEAWESEKSLKPGIPANPEADHEGQEQCD